MTLCTFAETELPAVYIHPREMLNPEMVTTIRKYAFEAEQKRKLTDQVLSLLYQSDALRVMIPAACGGCEWPLPKVVAFFEALAWADGNTGWLVNLGAGANMFAGYFEEATAKTIFQKSEVCCAGSGATSGKAICTKGGYLLSGRWKYASGSAHASHFTANAILHDKTGQPMIKDKQPEFRSFIFERKQVTVYDTWHTTGLCATSSNDFSVENLFVPDAHVFSLVSPSVYANTPLYHFPFEVLAVVNMACMPTGIGMHFIDLFHELAENKKPLYSDVLLKDNSIVKQITESVIPSFLTARESMYATLQQAWNCYEKGASAEPDLLNEVCKTAGTAAASARKMVFELYPLCGMNMVFPTSELNKVWRDLSVASQHYLLSPLS